VQTPLERENMDLIDVVHVESKNKGHMNTQQVPATKKATDLPNYSPMQMGMAPGARDVDDVSNFVNSEANGGAKTDGGLRNQD